MKKILLAICAAMLAFCACQDLDELTGRVENLENRVTYLEELCKDLNSNVELIQAFVTAHENDLYIKNVTEVSDGFTITFTNGMTYTLKNGEKGNKGDKGPQGETGPQGPQGEAAVTPIVSVKQDTDGGYYWTLNGEWILVDGKKVSALGVTPQLKIQDGKWMICYGGDKWEEIAPAYDHSTAITITEDENAVYLTLHDGTQFVIDKVPGFSFKVASTDVAVSAGKAIELAYTLSDADESVRFEVRGSYSAEVIPTDINSGIIKIAVPETVVKGYVLITAVKNSTSEFKAQYIDIEAGAINIATDTFPAGEFGSTIAIPVSTNIEYEVVIPEEATWLTVAPQTKAMRNETILLVAAANDSANERTAIVTIKSKDGAISNTVTVTQIGLTGAEAYFRVNTADINVESSATTATLKVEANVPWTITVPEGVKAEPSYGSTDADVVFTFASNDGNYAPVTVPVTVATSYTALATNSYAVNIIKAAKNPNDFTYVRWGNNLGENGAALTPLGEYGNQFRITKADGTLEINVVESDIPEGATVKYAFKSWTNLSVAQNGAKVDANTGKITITYMGDASATAARVHYGVITVTVGEGEAAVVRKFPLFVDQAGFRNGWDVRFTPFAPRFNPVTGGVVTPTVTYVKEDGSAVSGFTLDYRRNANWYNLNSNLKQETPAKGSCLVSVWEAYFSALGKSNNTAAISPISWYGDSNGTKGNTDKCAMFITPETFAITVNPGKFVFDGEPGDGVMIGTIQCNVDNIDPVNKGGAEIFPLIIWLDPTK